MIFLNTGLEKIEGFSFPNQWKIITDYIYSESKSLDDYNYDVNKGRAEGNFRRSKLYNEHMLISETIEDNPHYLPDSEIRRLMDEEKLFGEEFERTMKFPNGYVAKIEYWNSIDKQEPNKGIYHSKYRRLVLINNKNQVISDVIQDNPNFGKTPFDKEAFERSKRSCRL